MRQWSGVTLVMVLVLMCWVTPSQAQTSGGPIRAGDLVHIEVYRVPELTSTVQVDSDGNVKLAYVGDVHISGMKESEAAATVSSALKTILRNPRVTVSKSGMPVAMSTVPRGRTTEMIMEIIPLQNASAESLSSVLRGMSTDGGRISFDPDTNTLIITDTPSATRNIINVITRMDQMQSQITQVRIETKVAEVRVGALKELGVRWWAQGDTLGGGFFPPGSQDSTISSLHGNQSPSSSESIGSNSGSGSSTRRFIGDETFDRRLNVPVQIPLPGQSFLGFSSGGIDIGAMLDALASENKAEVLANPMILTSNHKTASIRMVDEFPIQEFGTEVTGATRTTVSFMELGIVLDVTPHVLQDATGTYVKMELHPEVSFPSGSVNGIPIRSVRSSDTIASVRDGQTLIVGGIMREEERRSETKLPGIANVPILGLLFKRKENSKQRTELMIFVTPTVHRRPEEITWDKMIDISENLKDSTMLTEAESWRDAQKD